VVLVVNLLTTRLLGMNKRGIISKRVGRIIRIQGVKGSGIRVKCLRIIEN